MHDLFDIVGLSRSAPPVEVRRVCVRLNRRIHPDFCLPAGTAGAAARSGPESRPVRLDIAVDFVAISTVIDRMQTSFFRNVHPRSTF